MRAFRKRAGYAQLRFCEKAISEMLRLLCLARALAGAWVCVFGEIAWAFVHGNASAWAFRYNACYAYFVSGVHAKEILLLATSCVCGCVVLGACGFQAGEKN
jgi:hypothetical protein